MNAAYFRWLLVILYTTKIMGLLSKQVTLEMKYKNSLTYLEKTKILQLKKCYHFIITTALLKKKKT